MKKINSIGYGPAILACGSVFVFPLPIMFCLLQKLLGQKYHLIILVKISAGIGFTILLLLAVLLCIELKQDKKRNKLYEENKNSKIKISNGYYECQQCGNQKVKEGEQICSVCGVKFIKS